MCILNTQIDLCMYIGGAFIICHASAANLANKRGMMMYCNIMLL